MFSYIKRVIGNVTVRENNGIITVEGVDADVIQKDIKNVWETNKINANMFLHIDRNSFSFLSFYATDILYTLSELTNSNHSIKISVRTLTKIKDRLLEYTWLSKTLELAPKVLDRSKLKEFIFTPLDFQNEFFNVYEENVYKYNLKGFMLAAAAGSGKTYTSLALSEMLDVDVTIVVCPKAALVKVWEESIKNLFNTVQKYWISSSENLPTGNEKFLICHYEALSKTLEYSKVLKGKKVSIILDESHNLNEINTLRSNNFIELCDVVKSKNVIWLSGTPFKATALEVIPLLRVIDPLFNSEVEESFRKIYGKSAKRAVEILNNRLGLVTFKVEKKELNLLAPVFSEIKVKIPNGNQYTLAEVKKQMQKFIAERYEYYESRKKNDLIVFYDCLDYYRNQIFSKTDIDLYDLYRKNLIVVIQSGGDFSAKDEIMFCNRFEGSKIIPILPPDKKSNFREVKSIVKYIKLKIQGEALGRVFGALRIQCHVDMVEKIDFKSVCESTVKKTVVFTSFVQVVEKTQNFLKEIGLLPLVVYGKTNVNLASIVSSFEKDSELNPLVATYKSLSTAVPLIMADTMILLDSPFRDYILQQAVSRIHRLGSTTQVYVYTCSLDTGEQMNISTRSFEILSQCQQFVESLTGITSPFVLTDNPEELEFSLEGLDIETIESVSNSKPSFINW